MHAGGRGKVWACDVGDTLQSRTHRKKSPFENNQTKIPQSKPDAFLGLRRLGNNVNFKTICALCAVLASTGAYSQQADIATCRSPAGKVYRHFNGILEKADAGWSDDKISGGVLTLVRTSNGTLDMLFIDARNKPISMTQDGAKLVLLRSSDRSISVLAHYPGATTEIYSFFQEKDGRNRYSVLTSRTGPQAALEKSSVMVGLCDPIKFDQLPQ